MRSTKWTLIIRMVAAVYIIYLAISLIGEIQKGAATGGMLVLGVIGIIAFFAFSVWAFVSSIKELIAESKRTPAETEDGEPVDEEVDEVEEEKARIRAIVEGSKEKTQAQQEQENSGSLFARMQRFSDETSDSGEADAESEGGQEQ